MNAIIIAYKILVSGMVIALLIGMSYMNLILHALAWGGMESANAPVLLNWCAVLFTGATLWSIFAGICYLGSLWNDK